ncbi:hypothetical protein BC829DRAFT_403554 [Chytridium lagenaria]|nr:hypothetical protein BC829DRAFT_403554 [Chytridium lagenaria]
MSVQGPHKHLPPLPGTPSQDHHISRPPIRATPTSSNSSRPKRTSTRRRRKSTVLVPITEKELESSDDEGGNSNDEHDMGSATNTSNDGEATPHLRCHLMRRRHTISVAGGVQVGTSPDLLACNQMIQQRTQKQEEPDAAASSSKETVEDDRRFTICGSNMDAFLSSIVAEIQPGLGPADTKALMTDNMLALDSAIFELMVEAKKKSERRKAGDVVDAENGEEDGSKKEKKAEDDDKKGGKGLSRSKTLPSSIKKWGGLGGGNDSKPSSSIAQDVAATSVENPPSPVSTLMRRGSLSSSPPNPISCVASRGSIAGTSTNLTPCLVRSSLSGIPANHHTSLGRRASFSNPITDTANATITNEQATRDGSSDLVTNPPPPHTIPRRASFSGVTSTQPHPSPVRRNSLTVIESQASIAATSAMPSASILVPKPAMTNFETLDDYMSPTKFGFHGGDGGNGDVGEVKEEEEVKLKGRTLPRTLTRTGTKGGGSCSQQAAAVGLKDENEESVKIHDVETGIVEEDVTTRKEKPKPVVKAWLKKLFRKKTK